MRELLIRCVVFGALGLAVGVAINYGNRLDISYETAKACLCASAMLSCFAMGYFTGRRA